MSITQNGRAFGFTYHQHPDFIKKDQIGEPWKHDILPEDGQDLVLRESTQKRLILRTKTFPEVPKHQGSSVNGAFYYQRRHNDGDEWTDPTEYFDGGNLRKGDCFKLNLGPTQLKEVFVAIARRYQELGGVARILEEAGIHTYDPENELIVKGRERELLTSIIESGDGVVETLHEILPNDMARSLSVLLQQKDREAAVAQFERFVELAIYELEPFDPDPWAEADWENFFDGNDWIFGVGLGSRKLSVIRRQANLGGVNVTGTGASRTDWLMSTESGVKFTVVVDIKTPEAKLLANRQSRNRTFRPSSALTEAVSQLQVYCNTWATDGSQNTHNHPSTLGAHTYQPKGIVVIGHTDELEDDNMRQSFELYRRNLINPEVITYDELLERAKFICRHETESANADIMGGVSF